MRDQDGTTQEQEQDKTTSISDPECTPQIYKGYGMVDKPPEATMSHNNIVL